MQFWKKLIDGAAGRVTGADPPRDGTIRSTPCRAGAPPRRSRSIRISGPQRDGRGYGSGGDHCPRPRRAGRADAAIRGKTDRRWTTRSCWSFRAPRPRRGRTSSKLHCHGGRAVVAAVEAALAGLSGVAAGRAGRVHAACARPTDGSIWPKPQGLGDLLAAQTEGQRRCRACRWPRGGSAGRYVTWIDEDRHGCPPGSRRCSIFRTRGTSTDDEATLLDRILERDDRAGWAWGSPCGRSKHPRSNGCTTGSES